MALCLDVYAAVPAKFGVGPGDISIHAPAQFTQRGRQACTDLLPAPGEIVCQGFNSRHDLRVQTH